MSKKSKLYTKTGDRGTTALTGGQRVRKSSLRLECYGTIDELNSFIGLLATRTLPEAQASLLQSIQNALFVVGAYLATLPEDVEMKASFAISEETLSKVEKAIDDIDSELPTMTGFILPAGGETAALAHVCRTVSRRSERLICTLAEEEPLDANTLRYINRLSDLFFAMARSASLREGYPEFLWEKS